ncbi:hypothetical protein BC567DRAFT_261178 [Phyllosticta citribraziliensis]
MANTPHTNGIYSDMSVDGPEIGTLVVVVDRAKNLPNRKTMGKQDPYCAARLGKEAKKTETDKRGGQTPKWDQELRFTVRESPDYYTMKVSVFNDDKKTELIGETFIRLFDVIVPGGGQSDTWHSLQCKGKYAGEIRLELTYYDTRPPSEATPVVEPKQEYAPVKRRPLPKNPAAPSESPIMAGEIPPPTKSPRSYHSLRHSPPKEPSSLPFSPADFDVYHQYPVQPVAQPPQHAHHARPQSIVLQTSRPMHDLRARPQSYIELPHAHSAPNVPTQDHMPDAFYDRDTHYPPDPREQPQPYPPRHEVALRDPAQQPGQNGNYSYGAAWRTKSAMQPTVEDEVEVAPPPPPAHRRTPPNALVQAPRYPVDMAPAPLNVRQERRLSHPRGHVTPGQSPQSANPPDFPPPLTPTTISPDHRVPPQHHRYSMSGYSPSNHYPVYQTPPRHPQQLEYHTPPSHSGATRPSPLVHSESAPAAPEQHYYQHQQLVPRDSEPMFRQRPVSPGPSPTDARQPRMMGRNTPNRKSVSPRPPPSEAPSQMVPYGPDSFNTYNPRASPTPPSRDGSGNQSRDMDLHARDEQGNIITQDGRKVDPSDHLPVDSWAPEPEPKGKDRNKQTPTRPRERLNGARELHSGGGPGRSAGNPGSDRAIRDAVETQFGRSPGGGHSPAMDASPSPSSNGSGSSNNMMMVAAPRRLQKRSTAPMPLRERENINTHVPPASSYNHHQQQHYSPHGGNGHQQYSPQHHHHPHNQNHFYAKSPGGGGGAAANYAGHGAPPIPAKIPINHQDGMGADDLAALSHELRGIDIGPAPSSTRRKWLRRS